jgi:uncharacterized protein
VTLLVRALLLILGGVLFFSSIGVVITWAPDQAAAPRRRRHRPLKIAFSGPRFGDDFDPSTGDVDFLMEFGALKANLEATLQREVDLVEPAPLRNPYLLAGRNGAREVVYAA